MTAFTSGSTLPNGYVGQAYNNYIYTNGTDAYGYYMWSSNERFVPPGNESLRRPCQQPVNHRYTHRRPEPTPSAFMFRTTTRGRLLTKRSR